MYRNSPSHSPSPSPSPSPEPVADFEPNEPDMPTMLKEKPKPLISPLVRSYIIEWIFIIVVLIIPLACAYFFIPFRTRAISLLDPTIQQPWIRLDSLPIISVIIPSVVIPLICFQLYPWMLSRWHRYFGLPPHKHSFRYSYWWSSCIVQTVGLTVLLSELSKRLVQAPRPDFLGRCFPNGIPPDVQELALRNNYIITTDLCQPTSTSTYQDGLQSFPSEHTSLAWCMSAVLILFFRTIRRELLLYSRPPVDHGPLYPDYPANPPIAGATEPAPLKPPILIGGGVTASAAVVAQEQQAKSQRSLPCATQPPFLRSHESSQPPSILNIVTGASFWPNSHVVYIAHILIPFGWALAVSLSRTFDHRHNVHDIIAGAAIGIGVAYAVFSMHLSKITVYHQRWQPVIDAYTAKPNVHTSSSRHLGELEEGRRRSTFRRPSLELMKTKSLPTNAFDVNRLNLGGVKAEELTPSQQGFTSSTISRPTAQSTHTMQRRESDADIDSQIERRADAAGQSLPTNRAQTADGLINVPQYNEDGYRR